jgi:hypothetical protein
MLSPGTSSNNITAASTGIMQHGILAAGAHLPQTVDEVSMALSIFSDL